MPGSVNANETLTTQTVANTGVPTVTNTATPTVTKIDAPSVQPTPHVDSGNKKKGSRKISTVWDHFTKVVDGESYDPINPRATCNYYKKTYACDTKKCGTSSLWNHLTNQCKKYPYRVEDKKQKILSFGEKDGSGNLMAVDFSKEACRVALTKMIVLDELPFSFVEREGFKLFCSIATPKFTPLSRRTIARDVFQLYLDERKRLKNVLTKNAQRVCLTTDCWTSSQNIGFLPNHKKDIIGKLIESCLIEWGLENVFTITVDNASANDQAVNYVKRKLKNWKNGVLVLDGAYLHLRCSAHIVNLIVHGGLKEMHESILRIRFAVRYVRSLPSRLKKFKECVEPVKIDCKGLVVLDAPTRWNSTYLMLVVALKFQKAFERLKEDDGHFVSYFIDGDGSMKKGSTPPTSDDWDNVAIFVRFLKTFYDVTLKFSGSLTVTSNTAFHEMCSIQQELTDLCNNGDHLLQKMAISMKSKYDKYWGSVGNVNELLLVSMVLDPRYKLAYVSFCFSFVYGANEVTFLTKGVKDVLVQLYDFYLKFEEHAPQASTIGSSSSSVPMEVIDDNSLGDARLSQFLKMRKFRNSGELRNELDRYLLEPPENPMNKQFDCLKWWKVHWEKYPILAKIAKDAFSIPVSTVASESAFSTGGRILDDYRSSLTPKMVEALICTQNWLRFSPISLGVESSSMEEMEFHEQLISDLSIAPTFDMDPID